jgi:hypothetical protein
MKRVGVSNSCLWQYNLILHVRQRLKETVPLVQHTLTSVVSNDYYLLMHCSKLLFTASFAHNTIFQNLYESDSLLQVINEM